MRVVQDYRTCVGVSLKVMQRLREKICRDSNEHYSVIYNGLYESKSVNVRELYFQQYEMEWLDSHWEEFTDLLKQYRKREQQDAALFFAQYFSAFLSEMDKTSPFAKVAMRDLIAAQKKAIEEMIACADNWEERNNQLKVNLKKHKEHFRKLLDDIQKQN